MNLKNQNNQHAAEDAPNWIEWVIEFFDTDDQHLMTLSVSREDAIQIRDQYQLEKHIMAGEYEIDCGKDSWLAGHFPVPDGARFAYIGARDTR